MCNRKYIFKGCIFHCYVFLKLQSFSSFITSKVHGANMPPRAVSICDEITFTLEIFTWDALGSKRMKQISPKHGHFMPIKFWVYQIDVLVFWPWHSGKGVDHPMKVTSFLDLGNTSQSEENPLPGWWHIIQRKDRVIPKETWFLYNSMNLLMLMSQMMSNVISTTRK